MHFTETCDEDQVHLITNVETTSAVIPDVEMGQKVHEELDKKNLLPKQHLVDAGYVDAQWLVESQQQHEITVIGRCGKTFTGSRVPRAASTSADSRSTGRTSR